jgi:hypothetical protein
MIGGRRTSPLLSWGLAGANMAVSGRFLLADSSRLGACTDAADDDDEVGSES